MKIIWKKFARVLRIDDICLSFKTKTMKTETVSKYLKSLNDYFVGKICAGDYEIIERGENTYLVSIDGEYKFQLWVSVKDSYFDVYFLGKKNTMDLKFTAKQKKIAYAKIQEDKKQTLEAEKENNERKQLAELLKKYQP